MNQQTVIYHSVPDDLFRKFMKMAEYFPQLMQDVEQIKKLQEIDNNGGVEKSTYSVKETAAKLGVSKSKVQQLYKSGELNFKQEKYRGTVLIYAESIEAYLNKGKSFEQL